MSRIRAILFLLLLAVVASANAQAPTGTIAGVVTDPAGAAVAGARITITNPASGLARNLTTSAEGDYSAAALLSGVYRVAVEAPGFALYERTATVEAGTTTTVNLTLQVGAVSEKVIVNDAAPLIHYEHHQVSGLVSRKQIENLPLNGRNFLELAKLEPGVTTPVRASNNRTLTPVLGAPAGNGGARTRVTVDGGSIMAVFNGGSAMGFSQEVVEEFQLTSVNFDLSTGQTASGAVNVVTRSGGNEFHGGAFYFFRDHNLAAYPALQRDPTNPDPFFRRNQFGFNLGGPISRDRIFFFANWERNNQQGVVSVQPRTPEFAGFGQIAPSPFLGTLLSARADFRATKNNYFFLRYSHDGSRAFGPSTTTVAVVNSAGTLPSNWTVQPAWADQSLAALTSTLGPNVVNEFRFSYFFISSSERAGQPVDCPSGCVGLGSPQINILDAGILLGRSLSVENLGRRYHFADTATWQAGTHRFRFGLEFEYNRGGLITTANDPVTIALYSPAEVRRYNALPTTRPDLRIPLPASFSTIEDILRLPLRSFTVGIGNPLPYQPNFGRVRTGHTWHFYGQDTWRLHPRLTLNYGLGWFYDPNPNRDLSKPAYLAPILGTQGLNPPRADRNDFSPSLGFAWTATRDGKTVIRGGGGIYYDMFNINTLPLDQERLSLGPRGTGRAAYPGSRLANPLPNIPGVPVGKVLNFPIDPSLFTSANLMAILPAVRADLLRLRGDSNNRDFAIRNIEVDKLGTVSAHDIATPYASHINLGIQREIFREFVVSADFVHRFFINSFSTFDYNRFNSVGGPIIPLCVGAQRDDPKALCSSGAITVFNNSGRAKYKGLLVRAEKRFSGRTQFLASYAYSSNIGLTGDNDNWFKYYAPLDRDVPHILNLSAIVELPLKLQVGFNSSYYSKAPFTTFVANVDFNGDGTDGDVLPGTRENQFNRGLGKRDLARLVEEFNRDFAGKRTARNQPIPLITLPADYEFGDNYVTQDLRLSRAFAFRERYKLMVMGEVFNLFNIANLSGHSGNLANAATFGQPTRRFDQVFGSGGPRAFQFAARVSL